MNKENYYKDRLERELAELKEELESIGRKNPDNPADWEATQTEISPDTADDTELGDSIEEYENNTAILKELEIRYNEVKGALERIEKGSYGKCHICDKEIEEKRLEANPAANTCIEHREED